MNSGHEQRSLTALRPWAGEKQIPSGGTLLRRKKLLVAAVSLLALLGGISPQLARAQTAPRIISLNRAGILVWTNVQTDRLYRIERCEALGRSWTNFGPSLQGTGATMTAIVPVSTSPIFYRVANIGSCCTNIGGTNLASAWYVGSACADINGAPTLLTFSGCGNSWFRVRGEECHTGLISPVDLKITCTLSPTPGTDYDLYVYANGSLKDSSTQGGSATEVTTETIPDSMFTDDSFERVIEVRKYSGSGCGSWTLTIRLGP